MLAEHIHQYLEDTYSIAPSSAQLSIYMFLHKKGLADTLWKAKLYTEKFGFEEFLAGFNQSAQRFLAVDVGEGKENADAKIKGLIKRVYYLTFKTAAYRFCFCSILAG